MNFINSQTKDKNHHPSKEHHYSRDYSNWKPGLPFDHTATISDGQDGAWFKAGEHVNLKALQKPPVKLNSLEMLSPQQIYEKLEPKKRPSKYGGDEEYFGYEDDFRVVQSAEGLHGGVSKHPDYIEDARISGQLEGYDGDRAKSRDWLPVHKKTYVNTGKTPIHKGENKNSEEIYKNFVHAHYITDPMTKEPEMFISSQSPTLAAIPKFLSLIHFKKIALLVMICQMSELTIEEGSHGIAKCSQYFPSKVGDTLKFEISKKQNIYITNMGEIEKNNFYIKRQLNISFEPSKKKGQVNKNSHTFTHVHMYGWVDMEAPKHAELKHIDDIMNLIGQTKIKFSRISVLIHCSMGIGRTGTFQAMYFLREQVEEYKKEIKEGKMRTGLPLFSVPRLVLSLKVMRQGSVQSRGQIKFLYEYLVGELDRATHEGFHQFEIKKNGNKNEKEERLFY